jgi:tetratricopeptide (TPR) repeat protein
MTVAGFLERFLQQHQKRPDHPFCFILGAGASQQSGIPTGGELATRWLEEMHTEESFAPVPFEEWATADRLSIKDFALDQAAKYYPEIYERRFKDHPEDGYAYLEREMDGKEPSFGYAALAYLMSETQHRIVITTNFDNLVGDALSIHSAHFPLVIGHEALAGFANVDPRRPLVAKIHGAVGFAPKNTPHETRTLSGAWRLPLRGILSRCTPIVIGYAGNDGSLMGFLAELPEGVPENVYWMVHSNEKDPSKICRSVSGGVRAFIAGKHGQVVPIPGFDEIMLLLYNHLSKPLEFPDLFDRLQERDSGREARFDEQVREIAKRLHPATEPVGPPVTKDAVPISAEVGDVAGLLTDAAAGLTARRGKKPWWQWVAEAETTTDPDKKQAIYQKALEELPENAPLLGSYANFLSDQRKDYDAAEAMYKRALEADPKDATNLGNYAIFLSDQRKDYDAAEAMYKRALEADPKHANNLGNYAGVLFRLGRFSEATEYLKRAERIQDKPLALTSELFFYRVAHDKESWPRVLAGLKKLIDAGARSPGWSFEANIARAEKDGHPNIRLLRALAEVITEGADPALLSDFAEWKEA